MPERTVFITGCSSGIGHATAMAFAERGYRVVATARKIGDLAELERQALAEGWTLKATTCDVSDEASRIGAVKFAHDAFGPVHILVNNAGYGLVGLVELVSLEDARRQLEVNTVGPMRLMQLVAPDMRAAGWGRVINVSSIVGRLTIPFSGWYSASKFALEALNNALRLELRPFGIHIVSILPGPVRTEFFNKSVMSTRDPKPELYQRAEQAYAEYRKRKRPFEISAEVVAQAIVRAAEARNPHPRYYLTLPARVGAIAARFLPDRALDRMIRAAYHVKRLAKSGDRS